MFVPAIKDFLRRGQQQKSYFCRAVFCCCCYSLFSSFSSVHAISFNEIWISFQLLPQQQTEFRVFFYVASSRYCPSLIYWNMRTKNSINLADAARDPARNIEMTSSTSRSHLARRMVSVNRRRLVAARSALTPTRKEV